MKFNLKFNWNAYWELVRGLLLVVSILIAIYLATRVLAWVSTNVHWTVATALTMFGLPAVLVLFLESTGLGAD